MTDPYTRHISYTFTVRDEVLCIESQGVTSDGLRWLRIEETRKNGQEDTHMSGYIVQTEDGENWEWDELEGGSEQFDTYHSQELSGGILKYINENPPPNPQV